ncbi:hypothetical protein ACFU99_04035 [Streptomyces sp. NPDC057654]|uniref:hypothetical protein n=1 Tax=Streptomyces sp. NPDC057654 TaxID=3346196 RepID=UPI0036A01190
MSSAPGDARTSGRVEQLNGSQLADLLMRLLLDERLRARLAGEGPAAVASGPGELECLETVDLAELDSAARQFRTAVWKMGRSGGIASAFPRSLRILAAAGVKDAELLTGFLGSEEFGRFRLVPYAGRGLSVEEAFASYLLGFVAAQRDHRLASVGAAAGADATVGADAAWSAGASEAHVVLRETVTHELMTALFTALVCEQPLSFDIAVEGIVTTGRGHAALRRYAPRSVASWSDRPATAARRESPGPVVSYAYFATPAGVTRGAVSAQLAAAFETTPSAEGDAARRALCGRGLW